MRCIHSFIVKWIIYNTQFRTSWPFEICSMHMRRSEDEHLTCITSHVCYSLSSLLPWRSSARTTVMRVAKQDHASRTEIAPLGSSCQKGQLMSQRAFFSVARCRPGFYAPRPQQVEKRIRESSGESRTSICQRCSAKTPNSLNMGRARHHGGDRKNKRWRSPGRVSRACRRLVGAPRVQHGTHTLTPSISAVR